MNDAAASWPMDIEQLLSPVFRAEGFFVVILPDTRKGQETAAALEEAGVPGTISSSTPATTSSVSTSNTSNGDPSSRKSSGR